MLGRAAASDGRFQNAFRRSRPFAAISTLGATARCSPQSTNFTLGLLLFALIHAADIQDGDGAPDVIKALRFRFPWLRHIFADGGYAGSKLAAAFAGFGAWTIEIVKRSDAAEGFIVLPRRWVVERTLAWPLQTPRQGLGKIRRKRHRMDKHRIHLHDHPPDRRLSCL